MDIKGALKKVGGIINPFDDIHAWVKREIAIAELRIKYWCLETIQTIMDKGIDGVQEDLQKEIDELEDK